MSLQGPLAGLRVVELAGLGPGPFGSMLLADLGADVIRIDRPDGHAGNPVPPALDLLSRGRRSVALNLKESSDLALALDLVGDADVLIEANRPGVAERLGIGPEHCRARNSRLVYARMTGWGQHGPLALQAGHDINYIARTGALDPIGSLGGPPVVPLNWIGDFGGGGMYLAFGVLAAVHHAVKTGEGQVVDVAITDGTALMLTMLHSWRGAGMWKDQRGANMLDGGAHFYGVYETADARYLAVGAIEPRFYQAFLTGLGIELDDEWRAAHSDSSLWSAKRSQIAQIVRSHTLTEWLDRYDSVDACVAPVLTAGEAATDPHNVARGTFFNADGRLQPAPGPRFSVTPAGIPSAPPEPGADSAQIKHAITSTGTWPPHPGRP